MSKGSFRKSSTAPTVSGCTRTIGFVPRRTSDVSATSLLPSLTVWASVQSSADTGTVRSSATAVIVSFSPRVRTSV